MVVKKAVKNEWLPEWDCRGIGADAVARRREFETWTNVRLDELRHWAVRPATYVTLLLIEGKAHFFPDGPPTAHKAKAFVLNDALKRKDFEELDRLRRDPTMAAAIQSLNKKGPKKGARKNPLVAAMHLTQARVQLRLIREIWKGAYGKSYRRDDNEPTAAQIVINRFLKAGIKLNRKQIGAG